MARRGTNGVGALIGALLTLAAAGALSADAGPPQLVLPVDCVPGESCWIVSYVDHDPTEGVRDYACGKATYNGTSGRIKRHKGTDIAIRDATAMAAGVAVRAAAAGVVAGVRDGMDDVSVRVAGIAALEGRDCGNGVRLAHGDGWITQYCHMRKGSVAVKQGDSVEAGQVLGLIGLSGATEYPHLHVEVRKDDEVVDPFVGPMRSGECGPGDAPLWTPDVVARLPYEPTALYNAGVAAEVPKPEAVRAGRPREAPLPRKAPALSVWGDRFNVRPGDRVTLRLRDPAGRLVVDHTATVPRDQARRFVFAGRRLKASAWPAGTYHGEIRLVPAATGPGARERTVTHTVTLR